MHQWRALWDPRLQYYRYKSEKNRWKLKKKNWKNKSWPAAATATPHCTPKHHQVYLHSHQWEVVNQGVILHQVRAVYKKISCQKHLKIQIYTEGRVPQEFSCTCWKACFKLVRMVESAEGLELPKILKFRHQRKNTFLYFLLKWIRMTLYSQVRSCSCSVILARSYDLTYKLTNQLFYFTHSF